VSGKVRMAMIGGGEGAFIGPVHRLAAELDGEIELVCGVFSADPATSRRSGVQMYGLSAERCYKDVNTMLAAERGLPEAERMEFVSVVTPNHLHVDMAQAVVKAGFPVVCDKPLSHSLKAGEGFRDLLERSEVLFALTHNYTGYPMIREARQLIANGELGRIRRIDCEYLQGWLATAEERSGNKQADWRTDPARAGAAGCFGDIGSHCQNLIEFVSGLEIESVCADLSAFVDGRAVDDDGNVLLRLNDEARGVISASQIAVGEENALSLRIFGEKGGLRWHQQAPNSLELRLADRPLQILRSATPALTNSASAASRLPPGHVEGYLEAFANLYREFAAQIRDVRAGVKPAPGLLPDIEAGMRGMRFIQAVVDSSTAGGEWREV
jgi:predicted dehydrogenase